MSQENSRAADALRFPLSRRQILRQMLGTGLLLPSARVLAAMNPNAADALLQTPPTPSPFTPAPFTLTPEDDSFLDELERASFLFFWEQGNAKTGMVKDRANVHTDNPGGAASIAATGFGMTALCIADQRKYMPTAALVERLFATLRFLWKKLPNHRGFFYHFANPETGERMFDSEVSSVDTAILLCGVISCREHFRHPAVVELANLILDRVDWSWLAEDTSLITHGWTP